MASVTDVRNLGTEITVTAYPLDEPIAAPASLATHLKRFEDNYDLSNVSHLMRYLVALCGDAGLGSLKKELLYGKLQQQLASTHFSDLDLLYGSPLALPRLSDELYTYDPRNEILTQAQWQEVRAKDAAYRARALIWMRAIIEGPTVKGMKYAAEAALGVECDVFERYKYIENLISDDPITLPNYGVTGSPNEFVIIPQTASITDEEHRRCVRLLDRLRPVNSLPTISTGSSLRLSRAARVVTSTTDLFYVQRYVTGRSDITWPTTDAGQGYWITTAENEVPTFAFMDRQETVTFPTIANVTASSEHMGQFNKFQQQLFPHLSSPPSPDFLFAANRSYAKSFVPLSLSSPWTYGYQADANKTLVNSSYPLGYFAILNTTQPETQSPDTFWASDEQLPSASDELIFDVGSPRPMNFINFDTSFKPVDIQIYYKDTNGDWQPVVHDDTYEESTSMAYLATQVVPWYRFEYHFSLIQTQFIRIVLTRRAEAFPFHDVYDFPWSVEIRNLRLHHIISQYSDFVEDVGFDILGNTFRTDAITFPASNVLDGNDETFWQSQPNPSPLAVEALYFDIRLNPLVGTMGALDIAESGSLDTRSMSDMEIYWQDGQVIDEVYVDPVTIGGIMHIYYSNDDEPDWDNKLWTPVPRHYPVSKGFHALPLPTLTKYVKLEFSRLPAAPYNAAEYPTFAPVEYRRYPTWVQDYFVGIAPTIPADTFSGSTDQVSIDPLKLGFKTPDDFMNQTKFDTRKPVLAQTQDEELGMIINLSQGIDSAQVNLESTIKFNTIFVWQNDLVSQLDESRALSRFVLQGETPYVTETPPIANDPITIQSSPDLSAAVVEKHVPIMWFPRKSRHQYQVVKTTRDTKLAFFVSIREVAFYRRDYTQRFDEDFYIETLDDSAHVQSTDLVNTGWRLEVLP